MDEFEQRLRDALRSQRLSVDPAPDLLERVHAGARRRQRRQWALTSGLAAVAVIALAATGVLLRPGSAGHPTTVAGASTTSTASASQHSASTPPVASTPSSPSPPAAFGSAAQVSPAGSTPAHFTPVSVSAASTSTFWVLGSEACNTGRCLALVATSDGGKTFTSLPPPAGPDTKGLTATQIRFGNGKDGWAWGNADTGVAMFFQTTDGGRSWSQVTSIPGHIVDLVAANGTAWAVVGLSPDNTTTHRFAIYSTPYGNSPQTWSPVKLPLADLGGDAPSIVDQDGVVTILASGPSRQGGHDHVLTAKPGGSFSDHQGPCFQDLGGTLSNSKKAIWAICPTGMMAQLSVSTDRGVSWQSPKHSPALTNSAAVGAIDDQHAMVMTPDGLLRIGIDGSSDKADAPVDGAVGARFIGFTDETTGFAVVNEPDGTTRLLRTTDAGTHWSAVTFGGQ